MPLGARPLGGRSLGDSAGEAMPRVTAGVVDITKAGFWQWFMPGVSSPGGGIGWSTNIVAPSGQDNTGTETGSGAESQSLAVARTATETASGTDSQSLVVARSAAETTAAAEAQALSTSMASSDLAVAIETESVHIYVSPSTFAYATISEFIVKNPATEQAAFASLAENVVDGVPTPHIWHLFPAAANRETMVTVVGYGFGEDPATFEGYVTLGSAVLPVEDWRRIAPGVDALSSEREINSANDTADPEHDRIDFRIPENAVSADVRVYLNAPEL